MKVLIVGDYPPPYGGSSVLVSVLHRRLSETPGMTCRVLDIGTTAAWRPGCIPARTPLEFVGRLLAHAARQYLIHLHTNGHNVKSWQLALACATAGILNGRKTLLSLGSGLAPDFMQQVGGSTRLIMRAALLGMGTVVCLNERTRSTIVGLGIPAEKVVHLPVVYDAAVSTHPAIAEPFERFLRAHHPVLAAISSPGAEYGMPLFLEAARRLRPSYPRLGVLLIGPERPDGNGFKDGFLAAGEQPHDVALSIMSRVTVFVRPTYFDGDALSVREALALGIPVVASDTDFRPKGTILFRRGNVEELEERLRDALSGTHRPHAQVAGSDGFVRLLELYEQLGS